MNEDKEISYKDINITVVVYNSSNITGLLRDTDVVSKGKIKEVTKNKDKIFQLRINGRQFMS